MKKLLTFLAVTALLMLAGCGGGSGDSNSSAQKGTATATITWPAKSRLIPNNADQITCNLYVNSILPANKLQSSGPISRPTGDSSTSPSTSTVSFNNLDPGTYFVEGIAANSGSATVALAQGNVQIQIVAGQTTPFVVTMNSTIFAYKANLLGHTGVTGVFAPADTSLKAGNVYDSIALTTAVPLKAPLDQDITVTGTPVDSAGNTLLLLSGSSNPEISTTPDSHFSLVGGNYRPVQTGAGSLKVGYRESGANFTIPITVNQYAAPGVLTLTSQGNAAFGISVRDQILELAPKPTVKAAVIVRDTSNKTAFYILPIDGSTQTLSTPTLAKTEVVGINPVPFFAGTTMLAGVFVANNSGGATNNVYGRFDDSSAAPSPDFWKADAGATKLIATALDQNGAPYLVTDNGTVRAQTFDPSLTTGALTPIATFSGISPTSFAASGTTSSPTFYCVANNLAHRLSVTGGAFAFANSLSGPGDIASFTTTASGVAAMNNLAYILDTTNQKVYVVLKDGVAPLQTISVGHSNPTDISVGRDSSGVNVLLVLCKPAGSPVVEVYRTN